MDSKDRKPARPSLFETVPAPAAQGHARISAGKVELGLSSKGRERRSLRAAWPVVLVVGLVAVGVAGWFAWSGPGAGDPMQAPDTVAADAVDASSTAVLVEGGLAHAGRIPAEDPLSIIRSNAEAVEAADADADAGKGTSDLASRLGLDVRGSGASTGERGTAAGDTRRTARSARSSGNEKDDLLAVLMANIRDTPENAPAPKSMDDLVAQISAPKPKPAVASAGSGTAATGNAGGLEQSSANVQRQLRSCPAANTAAGIRCRQRVCAKHRGDPACPAP